MFGMNFLSHLRGIQNHFIIKHYTITRKEKQLLLFCLRSGLNGKNLRLADLTELLISLFFFVEETAM